jgi:phage minor structural protein
MIRVYNPTEKLFDHNGIKVLHPLYAEIVKVDNGDYYIDLEDLLDNREYYQKGMIVRVSTPWGDQGFRCDNPKIQNNRITCKAWHLFYDSEDYVISEASADNKNCNDALNHYNLATDSESPFTVISDRPDSKSTSAVRKSLYAAFVDLTNIYGGHWVRDNYHFGIMSSIGQDRGVVLAYNKNITDIKVEEVWDSVCTKVLPYVKVDDEEITLDEVYVETTEQIYDIPYTKAIEFKFEEREGVDIPSSRSAWQDWLRAQAVLYLEANKLAKVNYQVSAKIDNISDVRDRIWLKHPKCKIDMELYVISVKYDAIKQRYTAVEFGNFKREMKSLVNEVATAIKADYEKQTVENNALLHTELGSATAEINAVLSGGFVIHNGSELLVVDRLPKENAKYCIKINRAGIGFSNTGVSGTFTSAWTIDGTLNMQAINVINLTASLIKGGTLRLGGINNSSGTFELYDNSNKLMALMDKDGLTVYAQNGDFVKLNAEVGFAGYNKSGTKIYWADGDVFRMKNAEVENEIKIAGKIKIVPVSTSENVGVGFVALN